MQVAGCSLKALFLAESNVEKKDVNFRSYDSCFSSPFSSLCPSQINVFSSVVEGVG